MPKAFKKLIIIVVVIAVVFFLLNPFVMIRAGQRGVVLNFGAVSDTIYDEGLHFRMPVYQKIVKMDVTTQKEEGSASAASKDMQIVTTDVAVNYYLNPEKVNTIYQTLKKDYRTRVILPTIDEFIKKTTALYTAEELLVKRTEVKEDLKQNITESLAKNYIIVKDIFITNFEFSAQFDAAIENKVTAEQQALKAANDLERVKMEAEQRVTQAKAEAEAIRIQAQAITSSGGQSYVDLQWIDAWKAGGAQVPHFITGSGGASFLYNLNQ